LRFYFARFYGLTRRGVTYRLMPQRPNSNNNQLHHSLTFTTTTSGNWHIGTYWNTVGLHHSRLTVQHHHGRELRRLCGLQLPHSIYLYSLRQCTTVWQIVNSTTWAGLV